MYWTLKFLDDNLVGLFCVFTVTAMAALSIHAVRTNNNSLLESYIFARYIIIGMIFFISMPGLVLMPWGRVIFIWLSWNGVMIFNLGITLIIQGIRR